MRSCVLTCVCGTWVWMPEPKFSHKRHRLGRLTCQWAPGAGIWSGTVLSLNFFFLTMHYRDPTLGFMIIYKPFADWPMYQALPMHFFFFFFFNYTYLLALYVCHGWECHTRVPQHMQVKGQLGVSSLSTTWFPGMELSRLSSKGLDPLHHLTGFFKSIKTAVSGNQV